MATLTVEGIPSGLLARLTNAAVANGRCVNSEVILSLVRHLREYPVRNEDARAGAIVSPFRPWIRSEVPPGLNVSWGDPG
jgi:adenylosuccinate synthase